MEYADQHPPSRAEMTSALHRLEDRMSDSRDEILEAVRDLKATMNGQFSKQAELNVRHTTILGRYGADIAVLQDRGSRDNTARWAAVGSGAMAAVAAWFGIR